VRDELRERGGVRSEEGGGARRVNKGVGTGLFSFNVKVQKPEQKPGELGSGTNRGAEPRAAGLAGVWGREGGAERERVGREELRGVVYLGQYLQDPSKKFVTAWSGKDFK